MISSSRENTLVRGEDAALPLELGDTGLIITEDDEAEDGERALSATLHSVALIRASALS